MARDPVVDHLEMALAAGQGRSGAKFAAHVERAIDLYGRAKGVTPSLPGALAAWQRERAEALLRASLETDCSIDAVASACGLSRGHFTRAFKKSTGFTPRRWLFARRLEHAERLLCEPGRTLSAIAAATGFADQSHLARAFKRATGMSPSEYRCKVR